MRPHGCIPSTARPCPLEHNQAVFSGLCYQYTCIQGHIDGARLEICYFTKLKRKRGKNELWQIIWMMVTLWLMMSLVPYPLHWLPVGSSPNHGAHHQLSTYASRARRAKRAENVFLLHSDWSRKYISSGKEFHSSGPFFIMLWHAMDWCTLGDNNFSETLWRVS